ncbi:hypothetical protein V8G54_004979 [Vigna mungo]|uniref:Uncharacterized protein n=1 Tax=Vigna mungo TaxID=3915 RepID=A0AAQ3PJA6_VIGMU
MHMIYLPYSDDIRLVEEALALEEDDVHKRKMKHYLTRKAWPENAISKDFNSLCEDARAKSYILEELSKIAKEKGLNDSTSEASLSEERNAHTLAIGLALVSTPSTTISSVNER